MFFSVLEGQASMIQSEMFRPAFEIPLAALVVLMVLAAVVARASPHHRRSLTGIPRMGASRVCA